MAIARLLLDAGAEISVVHHSLPSRSAIQHPVPSKTALQYAVGRGNMEMVTFLLSKGADPNMYTIDYHDLRPYSTPLSPLIGAMTPHHQQPNCDIISTIIEAGADVKAKSGRSEESPLHTLMRTRDSPEIAKVLLQRGARVNETTAHGETVLQIATRWSKINMIQTLIDAGANLNVPAGPRCGRTALQNATEMGSLEIVRLLLSQGADVNAPAGYEKGITVLQGGMRKGILKMVLELLEAGANIKAAPAVIDG